MEDNIIIKTGDITQEESCAIVNAANTSLMGGGGVDGAIHRAGGPKILQECKSIRDLKYPDGLPTGEAVATTAGNMSAKHVVHTVGPIYGNCADKCRKLLEACYINSLKVAKELGCKTVSFPAISTGIYGYPKDEAAHIAYESVQRFLKEVPEMEVRFVFHSESNKELFIHSINA